MAAPLLRGPPAAARPQRLHPATAARAPAASQPVVSSAAGPAGAAGPGRRSRRSRRGAEPPAAATVDAAGAFQAFRALTSCLSAFDAGRALVKPSPFLQPPPPFSSSTSPPVSRQRSRAQTPTWTCCRGMTPPCSPSRCVHQQGQPASPPPPPPLTPGHTGGGRLGRLGEEEDLPGSLRALLRGHAPKGPHLASESPAPG